ncbi:MAG: NAD(P)H-hydrate epimerase [Chloroflexota bacterium]
MPTTESSVPIVSASEVPTVSAAQMADVDRLAIEDFGITLLQMMEQAGSHLAEVVHLELGGDLTDHVVIVAVGPGNNGGGGLVAARHLANRGARVRVVLSRPALRMTKAGQHQLATLIAMGTSCCVATFDLADDELRDALAGADMIVDAILGYRLHGAPRGEEERLIGFVVGARRPVVSLDVPSGMDPDTGEASGSAVQARATLTLALPKPGLLTVEGAGRSGRLYLGDLGLPAPIYTALGVDAGLPFASGRLVLLDRGA